MALLLTVASLLQIVIAQQIGKIPEIHPKLRTWKCSTLNGCVPHDTSIVIDALSHPLHEIGNSSVSCGNYDTGLSPTLCATEESCAENCVLEGTNYAAHGVQTRGDSLIMHQYRTVNGTTSVVTPRVYLLDEGGKNYDMLRMLNQEISFDVDVSSLVCGMNGALYLAEMEETGGRGVLNPAGAQYGTGYCDAQCSVDPWINGVANVDGAGACCNEMDLWEANALSTALTPHACNISGVYACEGDLCGSDGVCDKSGCGFNPYALGNHDYYGYKDVVDTSKRFTVVTQFVTDDHTASGSLTEIRRLYVQNKRVIQNAVVNVTGTEVDSLTDEFCESESATYFEEMGGLKQIGKALGRGMVLIFAIWNDSGAYMNWLDSEGSGPCNSTQGNPALIEAEDPGTSVTFANIRWGDIGSTYGQ